MKSKQEIKKHLSNKFIKTEEISEIFALGLNTKKNIFLYGRGGHGKSEMAESFLELIDPTKSESFIQSCGEGLTEEKLFGGINLKKLTDTGEIEYLVENSFMNKKYVIFEELLDARINVLLSLKDILTSGYFRHGSQTYKIKTEMVIVLTNRTKQEVSADNSIKALMERFPLEMKIEWNSYNENDYQELFKKVLGNNRVALSGIIKSINDSGLFVSPRTAIHIAQCYDYMGYDALQYCGVNSQVIESLMDKIKEQELLEKLSKKYDLNEKEFHRIEDSFNSAQSVKEFKTILNKFTSWRENYKDLDSHSTLDSQRTGYLERSNSRIVECREKIIQSI